MKITVKHKTMDKTKLIHDIMLLGADTYDKAHTDKHKAQLKAEKLLDDYIQEVENFYVSIIEKAELKK